MRVACDRHGMFNDAQRGVSNQTLPGPFFQRTAGWQANLGRTHSATDKVSTTEMYKHNLCYFR